MYLGQFKDNKYDGIGQFTDKNKLIYEGQFKDGLKCGIGEQQCEDGTWIKGKWSEGQKDGPGCRYKGDRKTLLHTVDETGEELVEIEIDIENLKRMQAKKKWTDIMSPRKTVITIKNLSRGSTSHLNTLLMDSLKQKSQFDQVEEKSDDDFI